MSDYLVHHGIKGQKWGVRRYQNSDGSLTQLGKRRLVGDKDIKKDFDKTRSTAYTKAESHRYSVDDSKGHRVVTETVYREKFGGRGYYTTVHDPNRSSSGHGGTYGRFGTSSSSKEMEDRYDKIYEGVKEQRRQQSKAPGSESMNSGSGGVHYQRGERANESTSGSTRSGNLLDTRKSRSVRNQILANRETDTKAPGSDQMPDNSITRRNVQEAVDELRELEEEITRRNREQDTKAPGSENLNIGTANNVVKEKNQSPSKIAQKAVNLASSAISTVLSAVSSVSYTKAAKTETVKQGETLLQKIFGKLGKK